MSYVDNEGILTARKIKYIMPSQRITAAEAREISGPSVQERVEQVYALIIDAAHKGDRKVDLHGEFWAQQGYSGTDAYKEAVSLLEADGYVVKFYYKEHSFAVDMYTIVKW